MEKIKIRKFSDWWGKYDCSSNKNLPKFIQWLPKETKDNFDMTIYVDNYIRSHALNDKSKDKIGWVLESPQINENIIKFIIENIDTIKSEFKYIFTCLDELLIFGDPFRYTISNAVPWILENNRKIHPKTKLVSMIASNKSWVNGHRKRLEWVEKLKDKVDLFGTGRPNELKNKEDGIRDYMFSISIENDNSDTYFTEKLTDNFVMGTVPVYYGSRKVVEKYFDIRGVIFLEDDPTLSTLSEKKYFEMMPYIEKNFELSMKLPTSEDYFFEKYLKQ